MNMDMNLNSVLIRIAGRLAVAGLVGFLQGACAQPPVKNPSNAIAKESDAKALASEAYKRSVGDEVKKFDCHLAEETASEWIFVCKDLDDTPPPGADSMVLVKKISGTSEVVPGR